MNGPHYVTPETPAGLHEPITGYDLHRTPEFQALLRRLGVPVLRTGTVTIVVPGPRAADQLVRIVHEYDAPDTASPKLRGS